ncbi:uncharacterized protein KRP23_3350 [Phytophthora ramorum]|uniref:uncharacterized protein n=1 Tax=Phytophthora ramorum TaxID=164328 RepID=UPI0030B22691|nr:hypothetical protein KRP23_3350 [Phytophthora ramorum]
MADRMHAVERENERFREEIQHLRHFYSSNQQQHENDQLSVGKIAEDLQRLASSFNNKLQADMNHQQREQQKAALLFAEVSRLGHRVEGLEGELRGVVDDTQRKFEAQDQHAQFLASVGSKQQQAMSPGRTSEFQRQLRDMQDAMVHLRSELDADRSARWKNDAAVDAKLDAQLERLNTKLAADKRDLVRVLDEQRQLVTGADFQRVTSHMRDFSRVNDHLLALERWLHSEFGQIKRVFQALAGDVDARFQCVLTEVANGLKVWHTAQIRLEEEFGLRFQDLEEATRAVALTVQRKLRTLEEVIPLEVQARQKNDDKLKRRVEGVVKALGHAIETSRGEYLPQQSSLADRVHQLELDQRNASDEVSVQHNAMRETIQAFMEDSDAMLIRLAAAVEQERVKGVEMVSAREAALEIEPTHTSEELRAETNQVREDLSALQNWITKHEHECHQRLQAATVKTTIVHAPPVVAPGAVAAHTSEALAESKRVKEELGVLQAWTAMHAQECRQFFDFLNWSIDDTRRESAVAQCLDAVIDQVSEAQACGHLNTLTKGVHGALMQVAAVRAAVDAAPAVFRKETRTSPTQYHSQLSTQLHLQRVEKSSARGLVTEDTTDLSTTTYYASVDSENSVQVDELSIAPENVNVVDEGREPVDSTLESIDKGDSHAVTATSLPREDAGGCAAAASEAMDNMLDSLVSANNREDGQVFPGEIAASGFEASTVDAQQLNEDDEEEYSMDVSQDDDAGLDRPAGSHTNLTVHQGELHDEDAEAQDNPDQPAQIPVESPLLPTPDEEEPLTLDL